MTDPARPDFSVVVPFLDEQEALPRLRARLADLAGFPADHELILVSDGSTDGSAEYAESWAAADERVRLIVLSRNFGHQAAISAGLAHARGRFVGIMDADLQDPPEVLLQMYRLASDGRWDVVYNVRSAREGAGFKNLCYKVFYSLLSRLADVPVAADSGDFSVLSRRALNAVLDMPERVRFVRGLRSWIGMRSTPYPSVRPARSVGEPKYSLSKLVALALEGLTSFSSMPLRLATIMGFMLFVGGLAVAGIYLFLWAFCGIHEKVPGFTTLVVLLLCLSGGQFLMLGILGEYIGQIFIEVKRRPTFIVERLVNPGPKGGPGRDS